jgi:hypothetical protein
MTQKRTSCHFEERSDAAISRFSTIPPSLVFLQDDKRSFYVFRSGDNGQQDMGWAFFIVVNGLRGLDELCAGAEGPGSVQVPVEAREIAAGDFDSDFMAGQKGVACHPQIDFVTINFAWLD